MRNLNLSLALICLWAIVNSGDQPGAADRRSKTRAVTDLPFCALVLREWENGVTPGFDDYVIMEGDRMTEENLKLLFKVLSDQHSDEPNFQSWVYTDVTQLASIATQTGRSGE